MPDQERPEHRLRSLLPVRGLTLAVAESCTGGMLAARITDVAGSSEYFLGGVVAYSNPVKEAVLGVPAAVLVEHGAVSLETALAMAGGARELFGSDVAIAITGIAGPGGGSPEKPVGLVCLGLVSPGVRHAEANRFEGDRGAIRSASVDRAFELIERWLAGRLPPAGFPC